MVTQNELRQLIEGSASSRQGRESQVRVLPDNAPQLRVLPDRGSSGAARQPSVPPGFSVDPATGQMTSTELRENARNVQNSPEQRARDTQATVTNALSGVGDFFANLNDRATAGASEVAGQVASVVSPSFGAELLRAADSARSRVDTRGERSDQRRATQSGTRPQQGTERAQPAQAQPNAQGSQSRGSQPRDLSALEGLTRRDAAFLTGLLPTPGQPRDVDQVAGEALIAGAQSAVQQAAQTGNAKQIAEAQQQLQDVLKMVLFGEELVLGPGG